MVCCCALAGTPACKHCNNYKDYYGNDDNNNYHTWTNTGTGTGDYDYSKWLHVDLPKDQDWTAIYNEWCKKHPEWFSGTITPIEEPTFTIINNSQMITCKDCMYFEIDDDDVYCVYHCLNNVTAVEPDFGCIYGEKKI